MRWLAIAFAIVVASFTGATAYSQRQTRQIVTLSDTLAHNAMPSIRHLALARSEFHRIQGLVDDLVAEEKVPREAALKAILDARDSVDREMEAYLRLPVFPGEPEVFHRIREHVLAVDRAIATTRAFFEAGDVGRARASAVDVSRACDHVTGALLEDIELNAKEGEAIAGRIGGARHGSLVVALLLDGLSTVMTVFVAFFTMRAFGRHADLMRRHNDLLSDKADELEQFAGRVAHDVRNPIAAATMTFESIDRIAEGDERLRSKVARGIRNLRRASLLLDGLLSFARAGARPAPSARADVRAALRSCSEELLPVALAAGAELSSEPVRGGAVRCDQSILELVITNLVRNAIKYIGTGSPKRISLLATEARDFVRIEVRDTGVGVPDELKKIVFEPFVRGSREGSGVGLGLATVKKICDRHGGRVGVEPNYPCGSIFWFELPAVMKGDTRDLPSSHAAAASG